MNTWNRKGRQLNIYFEPWNYALEASESEVPIYAGGLIAFPRLFLFLLLIQSEKACKKLRGFNWYFQGNICIWCVVRNLSMGNPCCIFLWGHSSYYFLRMPSVRLLNCQTSEVHKNYRLTNGNSQDWIYNQC